MSSSKFLSRYGLFIMVCGFVMIFLPNSMVPASNIERHTSIIVGNMWLIFSLYLMIKSEHIKKEVEEDEN